MIERYRVYWVNLDPVIGSEIAKTRPAVVVSDNSMNQWLNTVVVCPLTTRLHPRWPSRIQIQLAGQASEIAVDQIRTIDKARIGQALDQLEATAITELRHIITSMYGVLAPAI